MPANGEYVPRVLVADDEAPMREILAHYLQKLGLTVLQAVDGREAIDKVASERPDLVITDVKMPRADGMEVVRALKGNPETRLIPVVMLTSLTDVETKVKALELGADDLLTKPPQMVELKARVLNLLKAKSYTDELERADTVLMALAETVEAKDPYTGRHCQRLAAWGTMVGTALGLPEEEVKALRYAGILHDLGKIAIPESILLKPGPLDDLEWKVMREHPVIGERLCKPMKSMKLVAPIVRHHHERFDGKGYPDGLAGEDIPLTARILQVVDACDALLTRRPYKQPIPRAEVLVILQREAEGGKWDPRVVAEFVKLMARPLPLEETLEGTPAH